MRIDRLLTEAALDLAQAGIAEAELDARLLLEHLTQMSRSQLVLRSDQPLDEATVTRYRQLVEQRCRRIPLQHLTGVQEFWSLEFSVSPAVLIPRPETEFLLEQVLAACGKAGVSRALDLCTGSGVIAVILARELACPVVAVDISEPALRVAAVNCSRHDAAGRVLLVAGDLFAPLHPACPFDLIVSNPPYVAEEAIGTLEPEVSLAEPRLALSGGPGGLRCIERIAREAVPYLRPGGLLFCEIGADQGRAAAAIFEASNLPYDNVRIIDDWAGRPRVIQARHILR